MERTIATTSLAVILLTAVAARADYPHPPANPTLCEEIPLALVGPDGPGGISSRNGIGGDGTTGPTFPSVCRHGANASALRLAPTA